MKALFPTLLLALALAAASSIRADVIASFTGGNNTPLTMSESALLIDGMKVYTMNCALCQGGLDNKPSPLRRSMYPPPPQVILEPLDDPEWHIFYAIRTGVRYTGMPAWSKVLNDESMWKLTAFLTRIEKLPPGVKDYWQKSFGVSPEPSGESHGESHHDHDKD